MKILIVSGSFFPINAPRAFRTTELVKEFVKQGHKVTLYIPYIEYDYSAFLKKYSNVKIFYTLNKEKNVVKSTGLSYKISRILNIFLEYPEVEYYFKLSSILKNEKDYDLLISIAVPHPIHWGIGRIYKKRKIARTWVADCGDPYMGVKTVNVPKMFYFKWFEKLWCKKCDYISVPTIESISGYYPEFRNKIRVIPQGFDFEAITLPEYKRNSIPTFAYAGSFIKGRREPQRLMEFLCSVTIPFKFLVFSTNGEAFMAPYKEKLGDKLECMKPISRVELLPIIAKMDFLINIGNGTNVQTPSKLIDYTLTKRPILTVQTDDMKSEIFNEFLIGNYEHRDADINISDYDIRNIVQQFIELCE
ncbi:hypothetical protein [Butyricimonas virosa]|jgi:hypothetical protein|uniref:hypothetical protein n=1 Tax=Butyricimonas virosa TaxID=544645 RepID=UPI0034A35E32